MIDESLQEQAALYASGTMSASEREHFELILEFHTEMRALVADLEHIAAATALATTPASSPLPSARLKTRLLDQLAECPQTQPEGFVMTTPEGFVQWVNPAFIEMCGYTLEELRGKKLGPVLQGQDTDRTAAQRMREAVHAFRPHKETILNYHKDGHSYLVEIALTPISDDAGQPRYFVARERKLKAA